MSQTTINNGDTGSVIRSAINDNFTELYKRDASAYGFLTTASAADNVLALQAALDDGGIITITAPGTYDLNATVFIGSNTALICSPGVILRKTGAYTHVILNKGALTKVYDENILIEGLEISVNGVDSYAYWEVVGLRGHLAFYYVRYLTVRNFKCLDVGSAQYCIHMFRWGFVHFDGVHIEGDKDGLDLGCGHDGIFENMYFKVGDDAILIYTIGFVNGTVENDKIYNVTIKNMVDDFYSEDDTHGFTIRLLYGSWADWANGNSYKQYDFAVNAGNLYHLMDSDSGFEVVGTDAPTHSTGDVKGSDGLTWRYLHACDYYHADIYNVTIDNLVSYSIRNTISAFFIEASYMRAVYPGTETLSSAYNLRLINSTIKDTEAQILNSDSNVKDFTLANCVFDNISTLITSYEGFDNYNDLLNIVVTGCTFKNIKTLILILSRRQGQLIDMSMSGNRYESVTTFDLSRYNVNSQMRMINHDIPIGSADIATLSPEVGDICRGTDGLYIYKSGGWVNLAI